MTTISDPSAMTPDDPRWLSWFMQQRRFDRLSRKAQTGASLITDFAAGVYEMGYPGQRRGSYELSDIVKVSRSTGGGIINQLGQFEWVGTNVPRLTHDPVTLQPLGLLIEEQRTNLYLNSNDFSQSSWARSNCTVSVSGSSQVGSATKIVMNAGISPTAGDASGLFVGGTSGVVGARTLSFLAKADVVTSLRLRNNASGALTAINLLTGVAAGDEFASCVITAAGSGWWRISATAASTNRLDQWSVRGGVTGNGVDGFFISGFQYEEASTHSSYIPTGASQVTRAADFATVNTLSPWYNATEGTLVLNTVCGQGSSSLPTAAALSDGTNANYMSFMIRNATNVFRAMTVRVANTEVAALSPASVSFGSVRCAGSYKENSFSASFNGSAPAIDTLGAVPVVSQLVIGRLLGGNLFNGIISRITYYPRVIDVQKASA